MPCSGEEEEEEEGRKIKKKERILDQEKEKTERAGEQRQV